jgi:uncharacterized protein affecting Mg2+/Co2+ transport
MAQSQQAQEPHHDKPKIPSTVRFLPLDCLAQILSFCTLGEIVHRCSLVGRRWKSAAETEGPWIAVIGSANIPAFFALQRFLCLNISVEQERVARIATLSQLEEEVGRCNSTFLKLKKLLSHFRALNSVGLTTFSSFVALSCRLVHTLRTGAIGVPDSENSFLARNSTQQLPLSLSSNSALPPCPRPATSVLSPVQGLNPLGERQPIASAGSGRLSSRAGSGMSIFTSKLEKEREERAQRRALKIRTMQLNLSNPLHCDERRRRLLHLQLWSIRPGLLCDEPVAGGARGTAAPQAQGQVDPFKILVQHNVPWDLLALYLCLGGQDVDFSPNRYDERRVHELEPQLPTVTGVEGLGLEVGSESVSSGSARNVQSSRDDSSDDEDVFSSPHGPANTRSRSREQGGTPAMRSRSRSPPSGDSSVSVEALSPPGAPGAMYSTAATVNRGMVDSFAVCNSAPRPWPERTHFAGMFGSVRYYDHVYNMFFLRPQHACVAFLDQVTTMEEANRPLRTRHSGTDAEPTTTAAPRATATAQSAPTPGRPSMPTPILNFPLEKVFPFGITARGGRLGVVLQDFAIRSTTNVDPFEEGQEGPETPTNGVRLYRRGTVVFYVPTSNPNNTFVVAPNIHLFFKRLVEGVTGTVAGRVPVPGEEGTRAAPSFGAALDAAAAGSAVHETSSFQTRRNLRQLFEFSPLTGSINLNPMYGPNTSYSVSNGVEIICSPFFLHDHSRKNVKYYYTYQITMRYIGGRGIPLYPTCQLLGRHWEIVSFDQWGGQRMETVDGQGVIGMFPILQLWNADGKPPSDFAPGAVARFQYSSCVEYRTPKGLMGGYLTFVPGTLENQLGPEFKVMLNPFFCRYEEEELKDPDSKYWRDLA